MRRAEQRAGRRFPDYRSLHEWSVSDPAGFWAEMWEFLDIIAPRPADRAVDVRLRT